jgi:hypothetical protein
VTKLRTMNSVEDALDQAIGLLGADKVAACIGKSASLVRQMADPDHDRQLPMTSALCVDRLLVEQGLPAVFAELAGSEVERQRARQAREAFAHNLFAQVMAEKPLPQAVRLVGEAADLLERVQAAEADDVVDGKELPSLLAGIEKLQKLVPALRRALQAKAAAGKGAGKRSR